MSQSVEVKASLRPWLLGAGCLVAVGLLACSLCMRRSC